MIHSTLGFIYTPDFQQVLLIEKEKPEFHKGKLNGLGGKNEPNETALACITREVKEESGLFIAETEWLAIGTLSWDVWYVEVFAAVYKNKKTAVSPDSDKVAWYPTQKLPSNVLTNLPWLIPLGKDALTNDSPPFVKTVYSS